MAEGLQIQIGANVSSAVQGLNQVQAELNQTEKDLVGLGNSVDKAAAKIRTLPTATGQATSTLTNFSRVVQDAPFGLIGIANNIDPLVTSFQQLKATTGSTGGAFKALIGQLAGPAGIALAISTTTSLLIAFGDRLFSSGSAAKELAEQSKKVAEAQEAIVQNLGQERSEVDKLIILLKSENTTRGQKETILNKLKQINPQYFGDLKNEAGLVDNLTAAYSKYIASLVARSEVAALSKELEDISTEILKLEKAGATTEVIDLGLQRGLDGRLQTTKILTKEQTNQLTLNTQLSAAERERQRILLEIAKRQEALISNTKIQIAAAKELKDVEERIVVNYSTRGILPQVNEAAKEIQKEIKPITIPAGIDLGADSRLSEQAKKNREYIRQTQKEFEQFSSNINKAFANIQIEGITTLAQGIGQALVGGDIGESFRAFGEVIASGLEIIGKQLIAVGGLAELTQKALAQLFSNPGLALAVGIGLVAAGAALRTSLNTGIKARALGGPVSGGEPYLVGERGPEIFVPRNSGTIIPNNRLNEYNDDNKLSLLNLGNITARALGGIVNFGNKYLVGERGSELFVPSVSGNILPNNSVGSFMGGRMSDIGGKNSVLRGQDIILAYARTQRSQLRVNG